MTFPNTGPPERLPRITTSWAASRETAQASEIDTSRRELGLVDRRSQLLPGTFGTWEEPQSTVYGLRDLQPWPLVFVIGERDVNSVNWFCGRRPHPRRRLIRLDPLQFVLCSIRRSHIGARVSGPPRDRHGLVIARIGQA